MPGRKPKNVEFLQTLQDIFDHPTNAAFARACGQKAPNMTNYLNGKKTPGKRVLRSCVEHSIGWQVMPIMDIKPIPKNLNELPDRPGIYVIYDSSARAIYVGKAKSFRTEVRQTLGRFIPVSLRVGPDLKKHFPKMRSIARYLSLYGISSPRLRHNIEALLLRAFANQTLNSHIGHFK